MGARAALRAASSQAHPKTTGIVRHVDELGRIVIPIEIRKRLGLGEKDPLEISVHDDVIMLSRPESFCVFCGAEDTLREHRGRAVCGTCITDLSA
jgi:AbrB family transcriptional regulator, transcriptional pleiotropic regulator of transition state genes